ncbi:YidC/Oxa1 family membrane protein insertase [Herbiconiux moechotypicola]|nr:YidC/Oxa1 family membrane protein insertase [Herbiconiux moechotypicola]MCS5730897.1 YidC/Oxa1 family membrane protein insertase [Herbiconiux moechotypicola]
MNIYDFGPIAAALDGASTVVTALTAWLTPWAGLNAAALAVVLVTIGVRLALVPVGVSQMRAQRMRVRLAPRLVELQKRHRRDPERLQRETMALYAEEKASPLAGCLPLLLQAPVLSLVYGLFVLPVIAGHPNALLGETLFGAPLGTSFVNAVVGGGDLPGVIAGIVLLALLTAVALLSRRLSMRLAPPAAAAPAPAPAASGLAGAPALPTASLTRALSWAPLITVVFAAFVPLAASLYLAVTTSWTLAERTVLAAVIS